MKNDISNCIEICQFLIDSSVYCFEIYQQLFNYILMLTYCLSHGYIAVKRHHYQATIIKESV